MVEKELTHLKNKWRDLKIALDDYSSSLSIKKRKCLYCAHICPKTYHSKKLQCLINKSLYDILLEQSTIFKDKNSNKIKDFYLTQRYPDEIIEKL